MNELSIYRLLCGQFPPYISSTFQEGITSTGTTPVQPSSPKPEVPAKPLLNQPSHHYVGAASPVQQSQIIHSPMPTQGIQQQTMQSQPMMQPQPVIQPQQQSPFVPGEYTVEPHLKT